MYKCIINISGDIKKLVTNYSKHSDIWIKYKTKKVITIHL